MNRLISITAAARLPWMPRRDGRPLHVATLYRWASRGVNGIKLSTVMVGRTRCTTEQELSDFFKALTEADMSKLAPVLRPASSREREQAARRAKEILHLGSTSKTGGGPDER